MSEGRQLVQDQEASASGGTVSKGTIADNEVRRQGYNLRENKDRW